MKGKKWYQLWPRPDFFPSGAWAWLLLPLIGGTCLLILIEIVVPALWPTP